ncbi:hypothetical protein KY342_05725 [Candidatus Woesearchaeota archaeon]|nr:hypothetical protein [Candidatus Woesearchaeota archaeon]
MKNKRKIEESEGLDRYKDIELKEDIQIMKILLKRLKKRYNISSTEIINLAKEEIVIPSSIYTKKLSPLEANVKYLKENLDLDYSKIAELLGRNRKTIWQAYKNSVKKKISKFKIAETRYVIPASNLKTELSILETTVVYLKDQYNLSYRYIAELLQRDERTIWTVYNRAMKKIKR